MNYAIRIAIGIPSALPSVMHETKRTDARSAVVQIKTNLSVVARTRIGD